MNLCNDQTDVQHHEEHKNEVIMPICQHCLRVLDRVGHYLINEFLSNSTSIYPSNPNIPSDFFSRQNVTIYSSRYLVEMAKLIIVKRQPPEWEVSHERNFS